LSGRVFEEGGDPVLFGDVVIFKNDRIINVAQTDLEGFFNIASIHYQVVDLEFRLVGLKTVVMKNVDLLQTKNLNVTMTEGVPLGEVVVVDYNVPLIEHDHTSNGMITAERIRNLPTKNINNIKAQSAGVTNDGAININGSRSNQTNYYIDGIRVGGGLFPAGTQKSTSEQASYQQDLADVLTGEMWNPYTHLVEWKEMQEADAMKPILQHYPHWVYEEIKTLSLKTQDGFAAVGIACQISTDDGRQWEAISDNQGIVRIPVRKERTTIKVRIGEDMKTFKTVRLDLEMNISDYCDPGENTVDIAFVVDATGSQGDEIKYLKNDLQKVAVRLELEGYQNNYSSVFFTDHSAEQGLPFIDFVSDINQFDAFVEKQYSRGGDECLTKALEIAINQMSWTAETKIMFVMLDFRYFEQTPDPVTMNRLFEEAVAKGIRIVPVTGSGIGRNMEYFMKTISTLSNGAYIGLTDHSGVGGSHLRQEANDLVVESLNDIIYQLVVDMSARDLCEEDAETLLCQQFSLSPTITSDVTTIHSQSRGKLQIRSMQGYLVSEERVQNGSTDVYVDDLVEGNYTLTFLSDEGVCSRQLLVSR